MKQLILRAIAQGLANRGYVPVHQSKLADFAAQAFVADKVGRLDMVPADRLHEALDLLPVSPSQLNQDFFALAANGWKRDGFFVEFGATDGHSLSNTWLLEKHFGWTGVLAEPGRGWRDKLRACDRSAARDFDCVWERSGETLQFHEDAAREFFHLAIAPAQRRPPARPGRQLHGEHRVAQRLA